MNFQIYLQNEKITNEYPNIFALEKSMNILENEYIRPKYMYIFEYQVICQRFLWRIVTIFIFHVNFYPHLNHFGPIINNFTHF